ncbi:toll/interleukin-1 receptor domain-containing protein [Mucilaginibacter sp.]|uniref:toll/interleukin-1 receptor domain-containing protein n=1 Tax=Mucilaginibacter sp. TaxID=1882438 RepID=UPI00260FC63A|nr:toll/interleukin-1 receptor domain-containing protein [Mucilaginibacter sp.]MDB4922914.1 hypothetical protein [Mucilaginibacter sp.]
MGYSAKSSEQVYRHILRQDHDDNGLSDGFSWSILMVNDSSAVCRDFLSQYTIDLCHRTGDRIRFVFFSELSEIETQDMAHSGKGGGSFLSQIVSAVTGMMSSNKFDLERNPWDDLRPDGLYPLNTPGKIQHHIDFETQSYAAIPGASEAMRLAQRFGIGRFVPCFIFFGDVGQPILRILPFGRRNAKELHLRLRRLIDSFYEINNDRIAYWTKFEKDIIDLCKQLQKPMKEIDQWGKNIGDTWQQLRKMAAYHTRLQNPPLDLTILEKMIRDYELSFEFREHVYSFLVKLTDMQSLQNDHLLIGKWLEKTKEEELTTWTLEKFYEGFSSILPERLKAEILQTASDKPKFLSYRSFNSELYHWWRHAGKQISKRFQNNHRGAWKLYSKAKFNASAPGHLAGILHNEYQVVLQTSNRQLIANEPKTSASAVLEALALHLEIDPHDGHWQTATLPYFEALEAYFSTLQQTAPAVIYELNEQKNLQLTWADCIPSHQQQNDHGLRNCFDKLGKLSSLQASVQEERDARVSLHNKLLAQRQSDRIHQMIINIGSWHTAAIPSISDAKAIWAALISSLVPLRKQMEEQVFALSKTIFHKKYPDTKFDRQEITLLLEKLDQYKEIISGFTFPFEDDPELLRIDLDRSVASVIGIQQDNDARKKADQLKREIHETIAGNDALLSSWGNKKVEMFGLSSAGQLILAITAIATTERFNELVIAFHAKDMDELSERLASRAQIKTFLDLLDVKELIALELKLNASPSNYEASVSTKASIYDTIFIALSLLPEDEECLASDSLSVVEALKLKAASQEYDVFLAHNSADQTATLQLGKILRARGVYPWIDDEQVPPGLWFQDVLQSAIRSVKSAAILIGTQGIGQWQNLELRSFIHRCVHEKIPLIPVLLPGVTSIPDDLVFLQGLGHVTFKENIFDQEAAAKLVWGITGKK